MTLSNVSIVLKGRCKNALMSTYCVMGKFCGIKQKLIHDHRLDHETQTDSADKLRLTQSNEHNKSFKKSTSRLT